MHYQKEKSRDPLVGSKSRSNIASAFVFVLDRGAIRPAACCMILEYCLPVSRVVVLLLLMMMMMLMMAMMALIHQQICEARSQPRSHSCACRSTTEILPGQLQTFPWLNSASQQTHCIPACRRRARFLLLAACCALLAFCSSLPRPKLSPPSTASSSPPHL